MKRSLTLAVLAMTLAGCSGSLGLVGTSEAPVGQTFLEVNPQTGQLSAKDGKERAAAELCYYRHPGTGEVGAWFKSKDSGGLEALQGMMAMQLQQQQLWAAERQAFLAEFKTLLQAYLAGRGAPAPTEPDEEPGIGELRHLVPSEPRPPCFPWSAATQGQSPEPGDQSPGVGEFRRSSRALPPPDWRLRPQLHPLRRLEAPEPDRLLRVLSAASRS